MNRTAPRTLRPALVALVGLGLLTFSLAGCNVNPEKSQAFVALLGRVKALEEGQKKAADSIKGINIDVTTLDESVRALKTDIAGMGGNPQQVDAVNKRIEALEQQVQALASKTTGAKPAADAAAPKKGEAAKPETKPATSKAPAAPKPAAEGAAQPKGKYYTMQPGDTLQSVAQKNGTTAAKLAAGSGMPADWSPMPGQSIFIPNP